MQELTPELASLVDELAKLPSIGKKSAQKLAFYLIERPIEEVETLSKTILDAKRHIGFCKKCYNLTSDELCSFCSSNSRDETNICVVENARDVVYIESTGAYKGLYHVLGGVISPLDGIGVEDIHLKPLLNRLEPVKEVILALNASVEGEATMIYIAKLLAPLEIKVTKLAVGMPIGSDLEYTDPLTLGKALEKRTKIT